MSQSNFDSKQFLNVFLQYKSTFRFPYLGDLVAYVKKTPAVSLIGQAPKDLQFLFQDLNNIAKEKQVTREITKEFPFLLTDDLESGGYPEIWSAYHETYIRGQRVLPLSFTDKLWLEHLGVPLRTPNGFGAEGFTMAIAFGVLLPIFKQYAQSDLQAYVYLMVACIVIYPLMYVLGRHIYLCRYPHKKHEFPDVDIEH